MHQTRIQLADVALDVRLAGPEDGPLIILLHGFPEFSYAWRRYLPVLAEEGYRVAAPDQRGYARSDKPEPVSAYALDHLAGDVVQLIQKLNHQSAFIVGHDWGAAVAWWTAIRHPDHVRRLVVMNIPHPIAFRRYLAWHPRQLMKSWYMLLFQLPWLPERIFEEHRLWRWMKKSGRPSAFDAGDMSKYLDAWSQPGAPTGMLNWYRAGSRLLLPGGFSGEARVEPETLIIWGKQEPLLSANLVAPSVALCRSARVRFFEEATHWVHHEEFDAIVPELLKFLDPARPG